MWIYIKTAPYRQNSYLQHLIEHLVIGGYWSIDRFFSHVYGVQGTSWINYSSFFVPSVLNVNEVLDQIFSPLDISVAQREMQMIKEELCGQKSDTTLLVNRIGKELYWKDFGRAQFGVKVSNTALQLEHQRYYTNEYLWITDDDFLIKKRPLKKMEDADFVSIKDPISGYYKVRWELYFTKIFEDSATTYALCYFLDWLIEVWGEFSSNYLGKAYHSPVFSEFFEYSDHLLLIVDQKTQAFLKKTLIDQNFFRLAKARFLGTDFMLQEIALIVEIRTWRYVDVLKLKNYIHSLDLSLIQNLLIF